MATCRVDHYQTLDKVYVSIFAKQADKLKSTISFDEAKVPIFHRIFSFLGHNLIKLQISLDILLPGPKRFKKELELFGPIDPSQSSFHYFGTKVSTT